MKKKKIFIGPIEIAGYYGNLANGMRSIGADVTFITFSQHVFGYGNEDESFLISFIKRLKNLYFQTSRKNFPLRFVFFCLAAIAQVAFFLSSLFRFNVFIFGFGQSLLPRNFDLPILKLCRKRIIFVMGMGSEMRPPYINGSFKCESFDNQLPVETLRKLTNKTVSKISRVEKHANLIIGSPYASTQFSRKMLINIFALGMPNFYKSAFVEPRLNNRAVRVLHSPSHPVAKGTNKIRQAINSLKSKGYQIEFVEIVGRPNAEVIEALKKCDFVIDQLYSDTPMAGFATEAAWFGKAAVVGGYGLNELKKYIPESMYPPSQICHPDNLESAVEQMIVDFDYRNSLGKKAYKFVHEQWTAKKVAERYLRLVQGDIPKEWLLDPSDIIYFYGVGQSEIQTKKNIQSLVGKYGVSALQLAHRPSLEKAFLTFAGL